MFRTTFPLIASLIAPMGLIAPAALAAPVTPIDLDGLALGAFVVGPVGPTVDSNFETEDGGALGDFSGGAACPAGFASCIPPENPADTVYTFVQTVVPGVDAVPNDAPFVGADVVDPGVVASYAIGFAPSGFDGTAGYSFGDAEGPGLSFEIDEAADGTLTFASVGADWTAGQSVRFFFQTTQPPSGPGGAYILSGDGTGTAAGPLPAEIAPIPVPAGGLLLLSAFGAMIAWRRRTA